MSDKKEKQVNLLKIENVERHIGKARRSVRRSRWAKIGKNFERRIGNILHFIMVVRFMDEREKNIQIWENRRFCEDEFIETPIQF